MFLQSHRSHTELHAATRICNWTNALRTVNGSTSWTQELELSESFQAFESNSDKGLQMVGPSLQTDPLNRWHNSLTCNLSDITLVFQTIHVYHHGNQPSTDQTRYGNQKTIRPRPQAWVPVGPHGTPSSRPNEQQQAANSWSWLVDSMSLPSQNMWLLTLLTNKHMESKIELKEYGYCIIG